MSDKEMIKKYMELFNVYKNSYAERVNYILISAQLHGVYSEISSEVIHYIKRNKKEPTNALNRLKIIKKSIENFDYLINDNQRQFELNNLLMNKNIELEQKLKIAESKLNELLEFNS